MIYKSNNLLIVTNFLTLIVFGSMWGIPGCGTSDYETLLPNGYLLERTNSCTIYILPPTTARQIYNGEWAVGPKIVAINTKNDIVYGKVEKSPNADPGPTTPGYFTLDTSKHEVVQGLNYEDWLKRLKGYGIDNPKTKLPSKL